MTHLRTPHIVDTYINPAATLIAAWRGLPREIQNILGWMFFGEANAGAGIFGGFAVTEGAARRSDVSRGALMSYDGTIASPDSKWGIGYSETTLSATHDAHDATNPRYDLLTLTWAHGTDTAEVTGRVGGTASSIPTQAGSIPTLHITKGTAAGSPTPPATPAGHFLLYYVLVPATSGALTYIDRRVYLPGPATRSDDTLTFKAEAADGTFTPLTLAAQKMASAETAWTSQIYRWSKTLDRPFITTARSGSVNRYFMLATERLWWEVVNWSGARTLLTSEANLSMAGVSGFGTGFLPISRDGTGAAKALASVSIPVQAARGLKVNAAKMRYEVQDAFDGTLTSFYVELRHVAANGTVTVLDNLPLTNTTGVKADSFVLASNPVIADGDSLEATFLLDHAADGTTVGDLKLFSVAVQFEEMN